MAKNLFFFIAALTLSPVASLAQQTATPPANPITASERGFYMVISGEVIAAAQKMPEENYSFKPTPEVRSFGQLVAHVADGQYEFCPAASGDTIAPKNIEKTKPPRQIWWPRSRRPLPTARPPMQR